MSSTDTIIIQQLSTADTKRMRDLLCVFSQAFDDVETYNQAPPTTAYLQHLLGQNHIIALVALKQGEVVGGLTAYELQKFEQARSELYLYDLAVSSEHRREGIATKLIETLTAIASAREAYVVFVQADLEDEPAIQLYTKIGIREDVLHFDIAVKRND